MKQYIWENMEKIWGKEPISEIVPLSDKVFIPAPEKLVPSRDYPFKKASRAEYNMKIGFKAYLKKREK